MSDPLQKLAQEIAENKAQILDDFLKAYIASRIDEKDFERKIKKLVLIEKRDGAVFKYWFEVKRGKSRKNI